MMKWMAYCILVVILAVGLAVASTPLGFVLKRSGIGTLGVGWAQAEGTITRGTISGLFTAQQAIGDVSLRFQPAAILRGHLRYRFDWGGVGGRGQGQLDLRGNGFDLTDLRLRQQVSALEGLMPPVRMIGGEIRLSDAYLHFDRAGCVDAGGRVFSDVLVRLSSQYGRGFGPLEGEVFCREGAVGVSLTSVSEREDRVFVEATYALPDRAQARVEVSTVDTAMSLALSQSGFTPQDGMWVFQARMDGGFQ